MSDVIDFKSRNKTTEVKVKPGKFQFHLFTSGATDKEGNELPGEVQQAEGYLKFGPQFIAVVDGPEDTASVVFAIQTPAVKYVKKVSSSDEIQGMLSL